MSADDARWCAAARLTLEREAQSLDAVTAGRLSAARHRALAEARTPEAWRGASRSHRGWFAGAGALMASLLLAVLLWRGNSPAEQFDAPSASQAAVLPATDGAGGSNRKPVSKSVAIDVEVIANLEFYDWLDEQDALL